MTTEQKRSPTSASGDDYYGVSEAEVNAWAERERRRRREWVDGPNEEEKREWAARRHRRRQSDYADGAGSDDLAEGRRVLDRMNVDTTLALVGAASLLAEAPYRLVGNLVRAGRDWEDETLATLQRRRRVRLPDED